MKQLYTLSSNIQTSSGLKKPNKSYENQKIILIFEIGENTPKMTTYLK